MGANKSPGNNGLSKKLYIWFFNKIHTYLVKSAESFFSNVQLSNSQRQGMITLNEKKAKIRDTAKIDEQSPKLMLMSK